MVLGGLISEDIHVSLVVVRNHRPFVPLRSVWPHLAALLLVLHLLAQAVDLMRLRRVRHEWLIAVVKAGWELGMTFVLLEKRVGHNSLELEAVLLVLIQDALEAVDEVFVVFVAVEHVEAGEHKLVLFVDEAVEQLNVLSIFEVVFSQTIYELQQLLLVFRYWR